MVGFRKRGWETKRETEREEKATMGSESEREVLMNVFISPLPNVSHVVTAQSLSTKWKPGCSTDSLKTTTGQLHSSSH